MTVILIGGSDNIKGIQESLSTITGTTILVDTFNPEHTTQTIPFLSGLSQFNDIIEIIPAPMQDIEYEFSTSYAPSWGCQGLLYRYSPKQAHSKIKPVKGYNDRANNIKSFTKIRY